MKSNYTFVAADLETAVLTALISESVSAGKSCFSGETEDWYERSFGRTPNLGFLAKQSAISRAMSSVMEGNHKDRMRYEAALERIHKINDKKEFRRIWFRNDWRGKNIRNSARKMAQALKKENPRKETGAIKAAM